MNVVRILILLPILTAMSLSAVHAASAQTPVGRVLSLAPSSDPTTVRCSIGQIAAFESGPITRTIRLRNNGVAATILTAIRPSCGCTSVLLGAHCSLPLVLAPGQQIPVQVTLDAYHLMPGPINKRIWFFVQGRSAPAGILVLSGAILPVATFTPALLDFGRIPAGQAASRTLRVAVDFKLLPKDVSVRLASADPDIRLVAIAAPDGEPSGIQQYTVTLASHARLGVLNSELLLTFDTSGNHTLPGGSVSVQGEVVGSVAAAPSVLAFGSVRAGQTATQEVLLTGTALHGLRVACASRFITVRLGAPRPAPRLNRPFGAPTRLNNAAESRDQVAPLVVTLHPDAPRGSLTAQVLVTTSNGQILALPVFAFIGSASMGSPSRSVKGTR